LWQRRQVEHRPRDPGDDADGVGHEANDGAVNGLDITGKIGPVEPEPVVVHIVGFFDTLDRVEDRRAVDGFAVEGDNDASHHRVDLCPVHALYAGQGSLEFPGEPLRSVASGCSYLDVGFAVAEPVPAVPTAR